MKPRNPAPRFTISSRSSPLLTLDRLERTAQRAELDGVDLDLTGSQLRRRRLALERRAESMAIATVWVSPSTKQPPIPWLDSRDHIADHIVVDEERGRIPNGKHQLRRAIQLREQIGGEVRVALAIRPRNPDGGRGHLARLSMIRSIAEEWDLDLALDLSGPVDWLWEAEAAVVRLGPRLRLMRFTSLQSALDSHIRSRLTQRTIAAAVDAAFDGVIAVVVPVPCWRWRDVTYLERSVRMSVERLSDRFGILPVRYRYPAHERSSAP